MSTKKILNPVETEAARAKLAEIRTVFSDWLWNDPERTARLARTYNDSFNHLRLRQYNGEHLTLPGSSSLITLRREQKNAVWRILTSPTTLLALHPGWGKTFTMIAAFMEMRRLGLKRKGLFAVPNHLVAQFSGFKLQGHNGFLSFMIVATMVDETSCNFD
jgi:N12 class adenine-specific DNA methylase